MTDGIGLDLTPARYVQYDDTGHVLVQGFASHEVLNAYEAQGQKILKLIDAGLPDDVKSLMDTDDYVDLSGTRPRLLKRPVWAGDFNPAPVLPKQEAVMAAVPACSVAITGPVTANHAHPGGDLKVGFTLPGVYTISFEAFPYMPVTRTLTVNPSTTAATATATVSATAGVKL